MAVEFDLLGDRVRLRTTAASDRQALIAIRSTPEVRGWWRGDDLEAEFDAELSDPDVDRLTIEIVDEAGSGRIIGLIQFEQSDDPEYAHAGIDLYIDPGMHRKGLATDAIRTLVRYLVDQRGHHRFVIDPAADNIGAIACYAKVGFRPVGIMRQYERRSDGTWGDGLLMEMLASDLG